MVEMRWEGCIPKLYSTTKYDLIQQTKIRKEQWKEVQDKDQSITIMWRLYHNLLKWSVGDKCRQRERKIKEELNKDAREEGAGVTITRAQNLAHSSLTFYLLFILFE